MNLYMITTTYYAQKGSHDSMLGHILAENDEQVYEYLKKDQKLNGFDIYTGWETEEEDIEESYEEKCEEYYWLEEGRTFKDIVIENLGDDCEELQTYDDLYHGLSCYGWKLVKENATEKDIIDLVERVR